MTNTNNFDDPNLEPDLSQDDDFGDFEENKKGTSFAEMVKGNPLVKFGLIGAGVVAVIALVSMAGGGEEKTPNSSVPATQTSFKDAPGTAEVTPEMKAALEDANTQRVEEASRTGDSAIVTPIDPPKNLLDAPVEQSSGEDPLLRWKQMQEERVRLQREQQQLETANQAVPQENEQVKAMADAMTTQVGNILGAQGMPAIKTMTVVEAEALRQPTMQVNPDGTVTPIGQPVSDQRLPVTPAKVILAAGKIDYGQILIEANSDVPGPVLAMLASGPFAGSKLLGSFNKSNEYLIIKFTTLVTKKGTSIPIDAYAINPNTSLTAMATDVDHRYFTRIVIPAAAKFVEGLGSAIATTTTTTSQSASSTTTTEEKPNLKEELGKGLEEAASSAASVLQEDAGKTEILVRVHAGTPIGVMFMKSITDQQLKQARDGVVAQNDQGGGQGGQPYQQQGQQNIGWFGNNGNGNLSPLQQLQQGVLSQQNLFNGQNDDQNNYQNSNNQIQ